MSASRKKKERNLAKASETAAQAGVNKAIRDGLIILGIVVVLIAAVVVTMLFVNKDREARELAPEYDVSVAAANIGEQELSVPIMNYYYVDAVTNYYQTYSSFLQYTGLDTATALDQQEYTADDSTAGENEEADKGEYVYWSDYFLGQAKETATSVYNIYADAVKDKYTANAEDLEAVDTAVDDLKTVARNNGVSLARFLATIYGKGCTEENYREYLTVRQIVSRYYKDYEDSLKYTDEQIKEEYEKDPSEYDGITYYLFSKSASEFTTTDEDGNTSEITDAEIKQAKDAAEAQKKNFDTKEIEPSESQPKSSITSSTTEEAANWLFDSARKEGDVELFESADGNTFYVVKYVSRDTHDYDLANATLISVSHEHDSDAEEEDHDAALEEAKEVFNKLVDKLDGIKTLEEFQALAEDYADDGVSSTELENVEKRTYSTEIDNWLFDKGTVGQAKSFEEGENLYIFWHTGMGDNSLKHMVETKLKNADLEKWDEDHTKANELTFNEEMKQYLNVSLVLDSMFNTPNNQAAATEGLEQEVEYDDTDVAADGESDAEAIEDDVEIAEDGAVVDDGAVAEDSTAAAEG